MIRKEIFEDKIGQEYEEVFVFSNGVLMAMTNTKIETVCLSEGTGSLIVRFGNGGGLVLLEHYSVRVEEYDSKALQSLRLEIYVNNFLRN